MTWFVTYTGFGAVLVGAILNVASTSTAARLAANRGCDYCRVNVIGHFPDDALGDSGLWRPRDASMAQVVVAALQTEQEKRFSPQ